MTPQQYRRFASVICEHCPHKRTCGLVLDAFTRNMDSSTASHFICDVIRYDFFMDLRGDMKDKQVSKMYIVATLFRNFWVGFNGGQSSNYFNLSVNPGFVKSYISQTEL